VTQAVEALCPKPEGSGFDSRWRHWNLRPHHGRQVKSSQSLIEMSTKNISWGVKAARA